MAAPGLHDARAQSAASSSALRVVGARSFSPMVENVDQTAAFYKRLGLNVTPPPGGETYPWDIVWRSLPI
jgi:hypothetical protein